MGGYACVMGPFCRVVDLTKQGVVHLQLTEREAYLAMFHFLEAHYKRGLEELGGLLGSLALLPDGSPADPACLQDWKLAVDAVRKGHAADLELSAQKPQT